MSQLSKYVFLVIQLLILSSLIACGGSSSDSPEPAEGLTWTSGVFEDEGNFKNLCQVPRSGTDINGDSFPDRAGSTLHENHWLRSWSNNTYLWYNEIVDQNPALFSTADYFTQLKTTQTTASGNLKDNFHFSIPTDEWLQQNQAGVSAGYGMRLAIIAATPPREVRIAFVEPGAPASANLARGMEIIEVDGVDVVNDGSQQDVDTINAALFPSDTGQTHNFKARKLDNSIIEFSMTSAAITTLPVQNVTTIDTASGKVGYMLFNTHIQTAEEGLLDAMTQLANAGVQDLVLDLRYNGGGLLAIASQLAYMIAGSSSTNGKTFDSLTFNNKHPSINPVTGQALTPTPFINTTVGFSVAAGQALPSLNLNRVFILSTGGTCSASEAIINGLRGVDIEVILIGSTTCGKPYGFFPTDNCGTTYFTIQFRGENDKGFGDYADGFSPANTAGTVGELVTGCSVADDFSHSLGDPQEAQLAAALGYRNSSTCPVPNVTRSAKITAKQGLQEGSLFNSQRYREFILMNENRFISQPGN